MFYNKYTRNRDKHASYTLKTTYIEFGPSSFRFRHARAQATVL